MSSEAKLAQRDPVTTPRSHRVESTDQSLELGANDGEPARPLPRPRGCKGPGISFHPFSRAPGRVG